MTKQERKYKDLTIKEISKEMLAAQCQNKLSTYLALQEELSLRISNDN